MPERAISRNGKEFPRIREPTYVSQDAETGIHSESFEEESKEHKCLVQVFNVTGDLKGYERDVADQLRSQQNVNVMGKYLHVLVFRVPEIWQSSCSIYD